MHLRGAEADCSGSISVIEMFRQIDRQFRQIARGGAKKIPGFPGISNPRDRF